MPSDLERYHDPLGDAIDRMGAMGSRLNDLGSKLDKAAKAVEAVGTTGQFADQIREAIENQLSGFKLTKLAGPLRTPSKLY